MDDLLEAMGMPMDRVRNVYKVLTRRKPMEDSTESKLAKVLSAFDLTAMGIGSTLGVGVYVLAGQVAKDQAGPSVILSFMIAAIASIFAGLCYAEFGARVPKAGSAYVYSYVTIGEFVAFIIGWNLILEYSIGSASVVKAISTYLDSMCGHMMSNYFSTHLPMKVVGLANYTDLFAFGVTSAFTGAIALGARESSRVNNVFTLLNLGVVLFVIIAGLFKVKASNWAIREADVKPGFGKGGFMPYGFTGIIRGAATCFYGFIGFDCIATAGEEAKNPKKSIPFAVITSLGVIFLAYFCMSTVLTMMLPYYEQDSDAPLPHVFRMYGWVVAEYLVSIGAMCALCASLMGAIFPLPRVVFAMASDGLLFRFMSEIHDKFRTPFNATLVSGFLTGILAAIFDLNQLIHMMSIGTLLAYSMVAGCVLILRFECDERRDMRGLANGHTLMDYNEENCALWRLLFNTHRSVVPTPRTGRIVTFMTTFYSLWCLVFSYQMTELMKAYSDDPAEVDGRIVTWINWALFALGAVPLFIMLLIISRQPLATSILSFKVPFVPWLPGISILINMYLMINLSVSTWIQFAAWLLIGIVIYFAYGIRNSRHRLRDLRAQGNSTADTNESTESIPMNGKMDSAGQPLMCLQSVGPATSEFY